jgi:hypothetical protein
MAAKESHKMPRWMLWLILIVLQLFALELLLSAYFFQRRGESPSAIVHYATYMYKRLARVSAKEAIGIYQEDSKFGYRHLPNAHGIHRQQSFHVTYTTGADGERPIPAPKSPLGRVLFLGSSFTFGFGVGDSENYPFLLATEHWQTWQVVNKAVSGWSTVHAYMLLEDELKRPDPPAVAIYNSIPDHICRNYLRPTWLKMLATSQRAHPHFELVEGKPVFQRVVTVKDSVQDEATVRRKELSLTESFIVGMHERAAAKGVRFFVVLLPQRFESACGPVAWPPSLIQSLARHGVTLVDLTELKGRLSWLEHDTHPAPEGHRFLASAIAQSAISESLRDVALLQEVKVKAKFSNRQ